MNVNPDDLPAEQQALIEVEKVAALAVWSEHDDKLATAELDSSVFAKHPFKVFHPKCLCYFIC